MAWRQHGLHHGANAAAMGVRARQFRAATRFIWTSILRPVNFGRKRTREGCRRDGSYCGEPTQTATSGVFEALGAGPQEAPLSPRNSA
jgi:hypothetical protein